MIVLCSFISDFYKSELMRENCEIWVSLPKMTRDKEKKRLKNFRHNRSISGIYSKLKFSAKKRNITITFSKDEFINWYNQQEQRCYYCRRTIKETKTDIGLNSSSYRLSIDRKNNNKGYKLDNIVLACNRCNIIKGKFFTAPEMLIIAKEILNKR